MKFKGTPEGAFFLPDCRLLRTIGKCHLQASSGRYGFGFTLSLAAIGCIRKAAARRAHRETERVSHPHTSLAKHAESHVATQREAG